jgi:hypothetical protein
LGAVGFNLNFINHYDAGESYTKKEHREWLTVAGFVDIERANFLLDDGSGLITARKRIYSEKLRRIRGLTKSGSWLMIRYQNGI